MSTVNRRDEGMKTTKLRAQVLGGIGLLLVTYGGWSVLTGILNLYLTLSPVYIAWALVGVAALAGGLRTLGRRRYHLRLYTCACPGNSESDGPACDCYTNGHSAGSRVVHNQLRTQALAPHAPDCRCEVCATATIVRQPVG